MRGKRYLWTLLILMFLASTTKISIPATSSPKVTFRVEPTVISGKSVGEMVTVDVYIDADPGAAIIGWAIDIKVDPDVLKPGYWIIPDIDEVLVSAGVSGYFLYDWCVANDWFPEPDPTEILVGSRNETAGTITGTAEAIKLWKDLGVGNGSDGTGNLVTFYFTSLDQNAWSPIEITKAYYYTSWKSPAVDERVPDLIINGHYNTPAHDVAVTDVSAPPSATVGDSVPINVSILNQGANAETFNLEVSANTTLIENRSVYLASSASGNETFTWNTTGMDPGNYTITANATLATDVDLSNNMRNTTIELKSPLGGDAAVTNIAPSISEAYTTWTIQVNVTVLNNGIQTMNCITVAYYHNGTTWVQMGTENVTNMLAGENATLTFDWNLAGVPYCNLTVKANAILLGANDTNPTNNEAYSWVKVRATGDVNGDGNVSVADIVEVDIALGSPWPWIHPYADVNGDGSISVADMVLIDIHLGETCKCAWSIYPSPNRIYLYPPEKKYHTPWSDGHQKLGENFTISVKVENVSTTGKLRDLEFKVWYNTTLLDYVSSSTPITWSIQWDKSNDTEGKVWLGGVLSPYLDGNITVFNITFNVTFVPPYCTYCPPSPENITVSCPLTLNEIELVDKDGKTYQPGTYSEENGYYKYTRDCQIC